MAIKKSQMTSVDIFLALVLCLPFTSISAQQKAEQGVLALVFEARGKAEVRTGARLLAARESQALRVGDRLELDGNARVLLLCTNGNLCEIRETEELDPDSCQCPVASLDEETLVRGGNIALSDPSPMIPPTIGLELDFNTVTVTGEARNELPDWTRIPMLLAPRCPADLSGRLGCAGYLEAPQTIRWLEVDGATGYRLALTGFPFRSFNVGDTNVRCSPAAAFDGRRACEASWPEEWSLAVSQSYKLQVLTELDGKRFSSGETSLSMLPVEEGDRIREALARLPKLDPMDAIWARSLIYSGAGMANEAVSLLEGAVEEAPSATMRLALGMAYRRVDALELAAETFYLADQDQDASQALIGFHLGQTLSDLGRDTEAIERLTGARSWFRQFGSVDEESEATRALSRAYRRNGDERSADKLFEESQLLIKSIER